MAKIYCKRILDGKMSLEDVPARWRDAVAEMLEDTHNE